MTAPAPVKGEVQTPHYPAAFINAIAEEGTKLEAVKWLQTTWNELCEAKRENAQLQAEVNRLRAAHDLGWAHKKCPLCDADMMTEASK